jgi:transposase-like protein
MIQAQAPDLTRRPRTRRVFSPDDMARMAALYHDPSVPLTQVAAAFGVPVSTFLRWIAEMDWPRRSSLGTSPVGIVRADPPAPAGRAGARAPAKGAERSPLDRIAPAPGSPNMQGTLKRVSQLARRELNAVAQAQPRTFAERERVARLLASLSLSLERVQKTLDAEIERASERRVRKRMKAEGRW